MMASDTVKIAQPGLIKDIGAWRAYLAQHWQSQQQEIRKLKFENEYQFLLAMSFSPMLPSSKTAMLRLVTILQKLRFCSALAQAIQKIYSSEDYTISLSDFVQKYLLQRDMNAKKQEALDWLLLSLDALQLAVAHSEKRQDWVKSLLTELREKPYNNSGMRVQAHMIAAGQNVVFAGRDVNIVGQYYQGSKALLHSYLAALRATWNQPELGSVLPGHNPYTMGLIRLHQLYTYVDVWRNNYFQDQDLTQLTKLRFRAIDQDLTDVRSSVLETIASEPLVVITGGPGTGKSALCRFIVTCLAYACDPEAERRDNVSGLTLLGSAWIHGALLPLHINLRNFCADKSVFPSQITKADATSLLAYIRKNCDSFAPELEKYLTASDLPTQGIFLTLDGLDEVYSENDRIILQRIIENWADRYPKCRVLVTSRSYAYRKDARWRLSERFFAAELAPLTWSQIERYIENWYSQAARFRTASFGGRETAEAHTKQLSKNLIKNIQDTRSLWPLARQPLLLALLTLIHEDNRRLPSKRAELYEQTVALLDRWNFAMPDDEPAKKFTNLQLDRVRASLKLTAFDLQCRQVQSQKYPASIHRKDLLEHLLEQQQQGTGLGASIEDVLEYLNTRNGILVSDQLDFYRFPHLSIQEYLAACALIELYDECPMPDKLKPESQDGWTFPENLAQLLKSDPYRWRNVTLFAGSIIATGKGQDRRWDLIDALMPTTITSSVQDDAVLSIYIAAEIWSESWLKARTRAQIGVQAHLILGLEAIKHDNRLDAPERANTLQILGQLQAARKRDETQEIEIRK
jgi:hypothetical protein